MADASEDFLSPNSTKSTPRPTSRSAHPPSPSDDIDADEENEEGILDFASLLPGPKAGSKPPSRGIKDFEPHGTQLQSSALAASRAAMHAVLSEERVHGGNHVDRAVWDGEFGGGAWVSRAGGNWSRVVGRSRRIEILDEDKQDEGEEEEDAQKEKKKKRFMARLWLLPEEALWLVERGTVDMRFPARPGEDEDGGLPMSLQGAYAVFLGEEKEGGLTLEKYTVFQYLKRAGYVVVRAEDNWNSIPKGDGQNRQAYDWNSLWARVFGKNLPNRGQSQVRMGNGPLVKPGLYRDYASIYRLLTLIPHHDPQTTPSVLPLPTPSTVDSGPSVTYHVYKPFTSYKKSLPGPPDYYISVINARESSLPTEPQIEALLRQTPYHPPQEQTNVYQKVKTGYRDVILAVVDQGVISFLNISDAGFGEAKLWERRPAGKREFKGGLKWKRGRHRVPGQKSG